jgi:hypothetical protein
MGVRILTQEKNGKRCSNIVIQITSNFLSAYCSVFFESESKITEA